MPASRTQLIVVVLGAAVGASMLGFLTLQGSTMKQNAMAIAQMEQRLKDSLTTTHHELARFQETTSNAIAQMEQRLKVSMATVTTQLQELARDQDNQVAKYRNLRSEVDSISNRERETQHQELARFQETTSNATAQMEQRLKLSMATVTTQLQELARDQAKYRNLRSEVDSISDRERERSDAWTNGPRYQELKRSLLDDWRVLNWEGPGQFNVMKNALVPNGKRLIVVWQAPHKGGSSGFMNVMLHFCAHMRLPVFSHTTIHGTTARLWKVYGGLEPDNDNVENPDDRDYFPLLRHVPDDQSACIGIQRNFDPPIDVPMTTFKVISMIRDPRDMIVSAYFSFGWLHSDAAANAHIRNMTVDQFALKEEPNPVGATEIGTAKFYKYIFLPLVGPQHLRFKVRHVSPVDRMIVSYNEMVLAYPHFLETIGAFLKVPKGLAHMIDQATCCTFKNSPTSLLRAMARLERSGETQHHIRSLLPGNYRQRLSESTNNELKRIFGPELDLLQSVWSWDAYSSYVPPEHLLDFSKVKPHQ